MIDSILSICVNAINQIIFGSC